MQDLKSTVKRLELFAMLLLLKRRTCPTGFYVLACGIFGTNQFLRFVNYVRGSIEIKYCILCPNTNWNA